MDALLIHILLLKYFVRGFSLINFARNEETPFLRAERLDDFLPLYPASRFSPRRVPTLEWQLKPLVIQSLGYSAIKIKYVTL
ncbi:hypothetical protein K1T71_012513 [Dendrolimus kikuchii]|uniref:Uncharacterized protein n=1 Tax=Dendrolimus kikuchii TaxID=765133 RepID=A0ACC1CJJ3_9NEOP|nr:hypothetical protein K1T71_012513 [Dendrolimus kikuchii]